MLIVLIYCIDCDNFFLFSVILYCKNTSLITLSGYNHVSNNNRLAFILGKSSWAVLIGKHYIASKIQNVLKACINIYKM